MVAYDVLDSQKTAILFFDMLNAYIHKTPDQEQTTAGAVEGCVKLRQAAQEKGAPIFYAQADHRPDGKDALTMYTDSNYGRAWTDPERQMTEVRISGAVSGSWEAQIIDELVVGPADYVIKKHRWSTFFQTHFDWSLRTRGVDTIVVCGGSIAVGVASTAYSARDLGYNLVFAKDCCTARSQEDLDFFMTRVFPGMGRIRTSDEVIAMLR
jgi:nicotinamidase-related amidase